MRLRVRVLGKTSRRQKSQSSLKSRSPPCTAGFVLVETQVREVAELAGMLLWGATPSPRSVFCFTCPRASNRGAVVDLPRRVTRQHTMAHARHAAQPAATMLRCNRERGGPTGGAPGGGGGGHVLYSAQVHFRMLRRVNFIVALAPSHLRRKKMAAVAVRPREVRACVPPRLL